MGKKNDYEDEEMTVELELDDGSVVNCAVITILTVNPDDPNEEPVLDYIEDDDEYEIVAEAFDEYLDSCEFDELTEESDT